MPSALFRERIYKTMEDGKEAVETAQRTENPENNKKTGEGREDLRSPSRRGQRRGLGRAGKRDENEGAVIKVRMKKQDLFVV